MDKATTKPLTIRDLLRRYRAQTGDYRDYEAIKREWGVIAPTSREYEQGIRAIADHVGV